MTLRELVPLVVAVGGPILALYGLSRLSRWWTGRHDPIDALITPPRWCKSKEGWMDTADSQKVERAGELRWQEALRGQRRTRRRPQPAPRPANVIAMRDKRRA